VQEVFPESEEIKKGELNMAGQKQVASLAPSTFVQGGLFDDIDMRIVDAAFCEWDYNGTIDHNVLALAVQFEDDEGKTYDQYFSAGELTAFVPSDDGSSAVPVGNKSAMAAGSNFSMFIGSMVECGFPEDKLAEGNIKCIIGTKGHVNRIAQPKRQGLIRGAAKEGRESTVVTFTSISELPGAAPAKKGLAKPGTGAKAAPVKAAGGKVNGAAKVTTKPTPATQAQGADDDAETAATEILLGILGEAGGTVEAKDLPKLAFAAATAKVKAGEMDTQTKQKVTGLVFKAPFLNGLKEQGLINYDGATVEQA
jgi:hypothetical protein